MTKILKAGHLHNYALEIVSLEVGHFKPWIKERIYQSEITENSIHYKQL